MSIFRKIKNTVVGAYISAGKVQNELSQMNAIEPQITNIREVKKQEIKIASKKKFYDILEHLENKDRQKYASLRNHIDDRTFVNRRYQSMDSLIPTYHIKTNNDLGSFTKHLNLINEDNNIVLEFVINTEENPSFKNRTFDDLSYVSVVENAKTYSYVIISHLGTIKNNPFETSMFYQVNVELNGVYNFHMEDTKPRVLTAKDCPPQNSTNYFS